MLKIEFSQNRVYGLDALRAYAIFTVVYGHSALIFSSESIKQILRFPNLDGVTIFFVLSGFLIGGILIKIIESKAISFSVLIEFWKRRWFRTLPNYFLILVITFALLGSGDALDFAAYALFLQNISTPHPAFFPEAWSLSVEEWFYLIIPIGIFLAIKSGMKPSQAVLLSIISIIVMSICIRYYKFYTIEINTMALWGPNIRKQVITRLDSIMIGVLGAYLNYYHCTLWLRYKKELFFAGLAMLVLYKALYLIRADLNLELNAYYCVYSLLLISLGTLFLLPFLSTYKRKEGRMYRTITIMSLISYSMYLINLSLVKNSFLPFVMQLAPVAWTGLGMEIFTYMVYWAITIVGSILIYKYYEAPFTKLRDRCFVKKV